MHADQAALIIARQRAGWSLRSNAAAAGVSTGAVRWWIAGGSPAARAAAQLAGSLTVDAPPARLYREPAIAVACPRLALLLAKGYTSRRHCVHRLAASGWPACYIASALGCTQSRVAQLMACKPDAIAVASLPDPGPPPQLHPGSCPAGRVKRVGEADLLAMQKLRGQGKSNTEISRRTGFSRKTVILALA